MAAEHPPTGGPRPFSARRLGAMSLVLALIAVLVRLVWLSIAFGQPFDVFAKPVTAESLPLLQTYATIPFLHVAGLVFAIAALIRGFVPGLAGVRDLLRDAIGLLAQRFEGRQMALAGVVINTLFLGLDLFMLSSRLLH